MRLSLCEFFHRFHHCGEDRYIQVIAKRMEFFSCVRFQYIGIIFISSVAAKLSNEEKINYRHCLSSFNTTAANPFIDGLKI
jgi:hypothetical protein